MHASHHPQAYTSIHVDQLSLGINHLVDFSNDKLNQLISTELPDKITSQPTTLAELNAKQSSELYRTACIIVGLDRHKTEKIGLSSIVKKLNSTANKFINIAVMVIVEEHFESLEEAIQNLKASVLFYDDQLLSHRLNQFIFRYNTQIKYKSLQVFLDESKDGYWFWDIKNDSIQWSTRTSNITGYAGDSVPSNMQEFVKLLHPEDIAQFQQALHDHCANNTEFHNIPLRILTKATTSKKYGDFLANGNLIRDGQGNPCLFIGSLNDRRLIAKVGQQLEETQQLYATVFHHMNDPALLINLDTGIVTQANKLAHTLWEQPNSTNQLIGSHYHSLYPEHTLAQPQGRLHKHMAMLKGNQKNTMILPVLDAHGKEISTEISASIINIGKEAYILSIFRDITNRLENEKVIREREVQIKMSSRMASIGQLAAGIGHDINNPLSYVIGNLELLKDNTENNNSKVKEWIDNAYTGALMAKGTVAYLIEITRLDDQRASCNVSEIVNVASRMAKMSLQHRSKVITDIDDLSEVAISGSKLAQIILNLLTNAAKAFGDRPKNQNLIKIIAKATDQGAHISVIDNGTGISKSKLSKILQPFYTTQRDIGGTGLGLTNCERILQDAGGRLDIQSELNLGTTVSAFIPFSTAPNNQTEIDAETVVITHQLLGDKSDNYRPKGMVIDDDIMITKLLKHVLKKDFEATIYNDAREAMKDLDVNNPPDFILCDYMMPNMDGRQFYMEAVKKLGHGDNILFMTGGAVTEENIKHEKEMLKLNRIIAKPFDFSKVKTPIHQLVTTNSKKAAHKMTNTTSISDTLYDQKKIYQLVDAMGSKPFCDAIDHFEKQIKSLSRTMTNDSSQAEQNHVSFTKKVHNLVTKAQTLGLKDIAKLMTLIEKASNNENQDKLGQQATKLTPATQQLHRLKRSLLYQEVIPAK